MKITLINPPLHPAGEHGRYLERDAIQTYTMPLGLGYIAAVLEKEGHEVKLIDSYAKSLGHEDTVRIMSGYSPDVVGITCLSDQRASWFRLIREIRNADSSIKIVLGGAHVTLMPEQVLENFRPDAIVLGEGEETMRELVAAWEQGQDLCGVKGIAYLDQGKPVFTPPRERIRDLDSLPFPSYHLVDLDEYRGWGLLSHLFSVRGITDIPKYASIATSRGCVGDCQYCSAPFIWKRRWTYRSAESVADEMEMLHRKYGVGFIIISDDIFSVNQKRVISLCEEILKRNLNIMWGFETAVKFVSEEMLALAKKAGCYVILYGVESGAEEIISSVSKNIREEDVLRAFRLTREAGIVSGAFLMVGNPGENEHTVNQTIELIRKAKPDVILPQVAMITPGTRFFEIAKSKGFIDEDFWLTEKPFPYYTAERSLKTLLRWYKKLFYHKHSELGILLRTIRDSIEFHTGMRLSKRGIEKVEVPPA